MVELDEINQTSIHDEHFAFSHGERIPKLTAFVMKLGVKDQKTAEKVMVGIAALFFVAAFFVVAFNSGLFEVKKSYSDEVSPGLKFEQSRNSTQ